MVDNPERRRRERYHFLQIETEIRQLFSLKPGKEKWEIEEINQHLKLFHPNPTTMLVLRKMALQGDLTLTEENQVIATVTQKKPSI